MQFNGIACNIYKKPTQISADILDSIINDQLDFKFMDSKAISTIPTPAAAVLKNQKSKQLMESGDSNNNNNSSNNNNNNSNNYNNNNN